MKKAMYPLLIAAGLGVCTLAAAPFAEAAKLGMTVQGKAVSFTYGQPYTDQGRSLFPLRDLLVALGVPNSGIQYAAATKTVTFKSGSDTVRLSVGSKALYKNGAVFRTLDVPAQEKAGRVYLPARAVAEALGYSVGYDAATGTVRLAKAAASELTSERVKALVHAAYGKKEAGLSSSDRATLQQLLNANADKRSELMLGLYDTENSEAAVNRELLSFIGEFLKGDLAPFADYSLAHPDDTAAGYQAAKLLTDADTRQTVPLLKKLLLGNTNEGVRYTVAYALYQLGTPEAFDALLQGLAQEKDPSVLGNAAAAAVQVAGADTAKIAQFLPLYANLSADQRLAIKDTMWYAISQDAKLKAAWTKVLADKLQNGTAEEKAAAAALSQDLGIK
ncbi:stalk domain-containing protein [Gorillibacterium sp. sgz500922]|uniref:stalk domain-containing protein n=1 Tax=Gorillibacterium sp. sgz500922 TaxID=3446694 RepID=UPI003F6713D1